MPDTYKKLVQTQIATTAPAAAVYTVPAATTTIVRSIKIANPTATAVTVKLHHVPSGGTASDANVILPTVALDPNGQATDDSVMILGAGESIRAVAGTATALTITMYGVESA